MKLLQSFAPWYTLHHACLMIISVTNITRRFEKKCASTRFPIGISETLVQSANNRSGQTMNKNKTKQNKTRQNKTKKTDTSINKCF